MCELFPASDEEHVAKKRRLEVELAQVNLEIAKWQLALVRAQAAKAEIEKKVLGLQYEELIQQKQVSRISQPPDSI